MPDIKNILNGKNKYIDKLIADFSKEFEQLSRYLKINISSVIKGGVPTREAIEQLFSEAGYDGIIQNFIDKHTELINYAKQVGGKLGFPLVLTDRSIALLEILEEQSIMRMLTVKDGIINNLIDAGLRGEIEGAGLRTIIAGLADEFDGIAHKFATEAFTGISVFDRTIKSENFKEAGIEKFIYFGPLDELTRDTCRAALTDPRQQTGWTIEEINNSPVGFTIGGGWNCRHEWLPFVGELK
ncbi:hypothetical protein AMJ80_03575 [bacterium SM23_31]|nr:MAG: hypothetical protein AMJ80_03575 [bacterium SM23_31]